MKVILDPEERQKIQSMVIEAVHDGIKQATNFKPYLNRKEVAKYFGVADSTISYWATLGMPIAVIDGRRLYGKQSITEWLKSKEQPKKEQNKKPLTIAVINGKKK